MPNYDSNVSFHLKRTFTIVQATAQFGTIVIYDCKMFLALFPGGNV
jgi:hypothetical protein